MTVKIDILNNMGGGEFLESPFKGKIYYSAFLMITQNTDKPRQNSNRMISRTSKRSLNNGRLFSGNLQRPERVKLNKNTKLNSPLGYTSFTGMGVNKK